MSPDQQSQFWSKLARRYDQVVDLQLGPKTRAMLRDRTAKEEALGRLVEFGCGTGFFTSVLASKATAVLATDLSPAMLELAKKETVAPNVRFQVADCQHSSLPGEGFDTAYLALVLQLTDPELTLPEMHRLLKPGGLLIVANLDPGALERWARFRSQVRSFYYGLTRYRVKPPRGFMKHLLTEKRLCEFLKKSGFTVVTTEMIKDPSRGSNIPVDYVRAVKM